MEFVLERALTWVIKVRFSPASCFHLLVSTMYFASLCGHYDVTCKYSTGAPDQYAGFWKYLTYWNQVFHFVFFFLSSMVDIIPPQSSAYDSILRIRDSAFAGIVFPYAMFVFVMFWGIYFLNRNKIFRKEDEQCYPAWLNHISHTVIIPVVLLEAYMVHHEFPNRLEGYALTAVFGGVYILWIVYLGIVKDLWVYIFMKDLSWSGKIIFVIASFILTFIFYMIGELLNYLFVGGAKQA